MIATIIILIGEVLGLYVHLVKHGQTNNDKYNFWIKLFEVIFELVLFYYAGLFDNFK